MEKCIFCDNHVKIELDNYLKTINCEICGKYTVSFDAFDLLPIILKEKYQNIEHIISGVIRERFENGLDIYPITQENFENILNSVSIPTTLREKLDKLILYVYKKSKKYHEVIYIPSKAIAYALDMDELRFMIKALGEERILGTQPNEMVYLTIKGVERAEEILNRRTDSKQCFVAMWFNEDVNNIYYENIIPAITENNFNPIRIDTKEFNNEILDEIISEIRKSRFMVADFTGNRGGVYYEAGFAYGLGLDVIFTCKEDYFNEWKDNEKKPEKDKIHFDINHKKFILWKNGEDLYNQLKKRISATIV